jgi:hypothetical protein
VGAGPVPPGLLVQPAQLSRYNVPSAFLAQFDAKPFLLEVLVGGALGALQLQWQYPGDTGWSAPIVSTAGASWAYTLDDTFADLTFAAGTYRAGDQYLVDAAGNVVPQGSALAGLISAARFDLRANACSAITSEALMLMADAITPPLLSWGDDVTMHAAEWVYERLKRGRGMAPSGAAAGDASVATEGFEARKFFAAIGENGRPSTMTDSSAPSDGPIALLPYGDCRRGW